VQPDFVPVALFYAAKSFNEVDQTQYSYNLARHSFAFVMEFRKYVVIASLLSSVVTSTAQQKRAPALQSGSKVSAESLSPHDRQIESALYLLQTSEAQAQRFDGPMRAAVLFAVGQTYAHLDRAKSIELLSSAYETAKFLVDDGNGDVGALRIEIVRAAAATMPETVEESLPSEPYLRDAALDQIVRHYIAKKKIAVAVEYYEKIEGEDTVYSCARLLLDAIPRADQDLSNQIFFRALRLYSLQQHRLITAGAPDDLGTLLVSFYDRFPRAAVLNAVDELLKQAKPDNAPERSQIRTSTGRSKDGRCHAGILIVLSVSIIPAFADLASARPNTCR
jgi:hypothetical protein